MLVQLDHIDLVAMSAYDAMANPAIPLSLQAQGGPHNQQANNTVANGR